MKTIYKTIIILFVTILLAFNSIVYATMADFTDEEADKITKQNQEEWKQEQEERIGKSSNNYLKSLSVDGYTLTPQFDKQTINYEIKEEIETDSITINTETDDEKSSVSGNGKVTLNSGENELRIDVTAENGTVRTYYIKVKTTGGITSNDIDTENEEETENEIEPESNTSEQNQEKQQIIINEKLVKYCILIVCIVFLITIILVIIKKNKVVGKHG